METSGRVVEIVPAPRPGPVRVVGPGRRERGYLERLAALEAELARERRALEAAELLERGSTRRLDRLEEQRGRLLVTLGALQRENELLRSHLALPAPRRSIWDRLLRRA